MPSDDAKTLSSKIFTEFSDIWSFKRLFHEQYPKRDESYLSQILKLMIAQQNYRLLVIFNQEKAVAMAGFHIGYLLYCGSYLQVSNFFVTNNQRRLGLASTLLERFEIIAKQESCQQIVLDSYLTNQNSHKIYLNKDFKISAYHFTKEIV